MRIQLNLLVFLFDVDLDVCLALLIYTNYYGVQKTLLCSLVNLEIRQKIYVPF